MAHVLWIFLILSWIGNAESSERHVVLYQKAVEADRLDRAIDELRLIGRQSQFYEWGLSEAAKILYRKERWSEFFGLAFVTRRQLSIESQKLHAMALLEVMALLKHCQIEKAKKIYTQVLSKKSFPSLAQSVSAVSEWLKFYKEVEVQKTPEDHTEKKAGFLREKDFWPMDRPSEKELVSLNPYRLRRRVPMICGLGATK